MIEFIFKIWDIITIFTTSLIISIGFITIYPLPEGQIVHKEPVKVEIPKPVIKSVIKSIQPVLEKPIIQSPVIQPVIDSQKLLAECIKIAEDLNYQRGNIAMTQSGIPQETRNSLLIEYQKISDRSKLDCVKKFAK